MGDDMTMETKERAIRLILALDGGAGPDIVRLAPKTREQLIEALAKKPSGGIYTHDDLRQLRRQPELRALAYAALDADPDAVAVEIRAGEVVATLHAEELADLRNEEACYRRDIEGRLP
jgi:hypothetical protein